MPTEPKGPTDRPTEPDCACEEPTEAKTGRIPGTAPGETSDANAEEIGADAGPTDPAGEWRAVPVFTIDSDEECGVVTFRCPAIEWSGRAESVVQEEPDTRDERIGDLSDVNE